MKTSWDMFYKIQSFISAMLGKEEHTDEVVIYTNKLLNIFNSNQAKKQLHTKCDTDLVRLGKENQELKEKIDNAAKWCISLEDKVSRRNMQIKSLKEERKELEDLTWKNEQELNEYSRTVEHLEKQRAELRRRLAVAEDYSIKLKAEKKEIVANGNSIMLQDKSATNYLQQRYCQALKDAGVNPHSKDFRVKYFNTNE